MTNALMKPSLYIEIHWLFFRSLSLSIAIYRANVNDWTANYEKITDMIVPRSSQLISQDADYALFNVTLFKKVVEEFKLHAREKKFVVRDFTYNEEELAAGKSEITKLVTDKKKQFVSSQPNHIQY